MTEHTTPTARQTVSAPDFGCGWSLTHLLGALSLRAGARGSEAGWSDPASPAPVAPAGRAGERVAHAS